MAGEQDGVDTNLETVAPKAPVTYCRPVTSDGIGVENPRKLTSTPSH